MGILPPDFIGLERLRKIRQDLRYSDLLSELMDQRREAAEDAPQSEVRQNETGSPGEIVETNSEPVGLMVTQDRSNPLRPSENASALAGAAVACASSSRVQDDYGFSGCEEIDVLIKSPETRPDPLTLSVAVSPINSKGTAKLPGLGVPGLRRNARLRSKKLFFAAEKPANITALGVCGEPPVKELASPQEPVTVTGVCGGPPGLGSPSQSPDKMRHQMCADGCLGGALPSPGMPEVRAEKGGEAVALELDGEV